MIHFASIEGKFTILNIQRKPIMFFSHTFTFDDDSWQKKKKKKKKTTFSNSLY